MYSLIFKSYPETKYKPSQFFFKKKSSSSFASDFAFDPYQTGRLVCARTISPPLHALGWGAKRPGNHFTRFYTNLYRQKLCFLILSYNLSNLMMELYGKKKADAFYLTQHTSPVTGFWNRWQLSYPSCYSYDNSCAFARAVQSFFLGHVIRWKYFEWVLVAALLGIIKYSKNSSKRTIC